MMPRRGHITALTEEQQQALDEDGMHTKPTWHDNMHREMTGQISNLVSEDSVFGLRTRELSPARCSPVRVETNRSLSPLVASALASRKSPNGMQAGTLSAVQNHTRQMVFVAGDNCSGVRPPGMKMPEQNTVRPGPKRKMSVLHGPLIVVTQAGSKESYVCFDSNKRTPEKVSHPADQLMNANDTFSSPRCSDYEVCTKNVSSDGSVICSDIVKDSPYHIAVSGKLNFDKSNTASDEATLNRSSIEKVVHSPNTDIHMPSSIYGTQATNIESILSGLNISKSSTCADLDDADSNSRNASFLSESLASDTSFSESARSGSLRDFSLRKEDNVRRKMSDLKLTIPDNRATDPLYLKDQSSSSSSSTSQEQLKVAKPKVTSPQILEQHISKIISENAAIVETLDPLWNKRYMRHANFPSSDSSPGKPNGSFRRYSVDMNYASRSKLQSALMGNFHQGRRVSESHLHFQELQMSRAASKSSLSGLSTDTVPIPSGSVGIDDSLYSGRSTVKSMLSLHSPKKAINDEGTSNTLNSDEQNPEGSIIKDLLLKTRNSKFYQQKSALYGDSREGLPRESEKSALKKPDMDDCSLVYVCNLCNIPFRSKDNLETHQLHYCKGASRSSSEHHSNTTPVITTFKSPSKPSDQDLFTSDENGQILKKHLLAPPTVSAQNPPPKKRKISEPVISLSRQPPLVPTRALDDMVGHRINVISKSFSSPVQKTQPVQLFGGEVQVMDKTEHAAQINRNRSSEEEPVGFSNYKNSTVPLREKGAPPGTDSLSTSAVLVTIAKPVLNSGGTVMHMSTTPPSTSLNSPVYFPAVNTRCSPVPVISETRLNTSSSAFAGSSIDFPSLSFASESHLQNWTSGLTETTSESKEMWACPKPVSKELEKRTVSDALAVSQEQVFSSTASSSNSETSAVLFSPGSSSSSVYTSEKVDLESPKKSVPLARPTSLPIRKKVVTLVGSTLVSPETPRPKKTCMQLYINGHAYTYLGLKCSTRSTYCCIYRPQPMYVSQDADPKLSMYSNWQVVPPKQEIPDVTSTQLLSLYDSRQWLHSGKIRMSLSPSNSASIFTHSSYWIYRSQEKEKAQKTSKDDEKGTTDADVSVEGKTSVADIVGSEAGFSEKPVSLPEETSVQGEEPPSSPNASFEEGNSGSRNQSEVPSGDSQDESSEAQNEGGSSNAPKRVKIFEGGFKSNEDYTYVRGRGRGKYVCEECGIRCKKPSMLKKHIRTHTDLRPYTCKHCTFAFKTKGNLTKHMKSKAHHKKCVELGIVPVPTTIDDSQIDMETLAKQEQRKQDHPYSDDDDDDDDDIDDDDSEGLDDEGEYENGESDIIPKENSSYSQDSNCQPCPENSSEQFEDAALEVTPPGPAPEMVEQEQEAARSLLDLSSFTVPVTWSGFSNPSGLLPHSPEHLPSSQSPTVPPITRSSFDSCPPSVCAPLPVQESASWLPGPSEEARSSPLSAQSPASPLLTANSPAGHWNAHPVSGHRPRSYSMDFSQSVIQEKRLSQANLSATVEKESFSYRDYSARRYSMSSVNEVGNMRITNLPGSVLKIQQRGPEGFGEQPMDLRTARSRRIEILPGGIISRVPVQSYIRARNENVVQSPQVMENFLGESSRSKSDSTESLLGTCLQYGSSATAVYRKSSLSLVGENHQPQIPLPQIAENKSSPEITEYQPVSPVSHPPDPHYYTPQDHPVSSFPVNSSELGSTSETSPTPQGSIVCSQGLEDGKCTCSICNKTFPKPSQLRMHVNIHYFERPFRCDSCAVSFRTRGHLQKHKRSVSHYNRVNMNLTFGTPTADNPRPFKCADCKIAFRIHGHLAKHLRSKMHIMKLECLGKLPFGMYAEMERSGVNLNEIDTSDCENSLESLQVMAQKLYHQNPRRMRWPASPPSGTEMTSENDDASLHHVTLPSDHYLSSIPEEVPAVERMATRTDVNVLHLHLPALGSEVKTEPSEAGEPFYSSPEGNDQSVIVSPKDVGLQSPGMSLEKTTVSDTDSGIVHLQRSCTCEICGKRLKSAKSLQVHLHVDHKGATFTGGSSHSYPEESNIVGEQFDVVSHSGSVVENFACSICRKQFPSDTLLQQHFISHTQPRPYVCDKCDAGFTSAALLTNHASTHEQDQSHMCQECGKVFTMFASFQRHLQAHLNDTR